MKSKQKTTPSFYDPDEIEEMKVSNEKICWNCKSVVDTVYCFTCGRKNEGNIKNDGTNSLHNG